jgi:hypothetical protein
MSMEATMEMSIAKSVSEFVNWAYSKVNSGSASQESKSLNELSAPGSLLQRRQQALERIPLASEWALESAKYQPLTPSLPNKEGLVSVTSLVVGARRCNGRGIIYAFVDSVGRRAYLHDGIHPRTGKAIGGQALNPNQIPDAVWEALEAWRASLQSEDISCGSVR